MSSQSQFGRAFAAARAAGQKTFTWNGKSYTTQTKEEAAGPVRRTNAYDVMEARHGDQVENAALRARTARARSMAEGTRASRLQAQAAERAAVNARVQRANENRRSAEQSDAITARQASAASEAAESRRRAGAEASRQESMTRELAYSEARKRQATR